jgi:hypothetical protein
MDLLLIPFTNNTYNNKYPKLPIYKKYKALLSLDIVLFQKIGISSITARPIKPTMDFILDIFGLFLIINITTVIVITITLIIKNKGISSALNPLLILNIINNKLGIIYFMSLVIINIIIIDIINVSIPIIELNIYPIKVIMVNNTKYRS